MTITVTPAQLAEIENMFDVDIEDEVRTDYSGRGMFGRSCLAYTGGSPTEFTAALALVILQSRGGEEGAWELFEVIGEIGDGSHDSMGRGSITYWPHITVTEGDDDN